MKVLMKLLSSVSLVFSSFFCKQKLFYQKRISYVDCLIRETTTYASFLPRNKNGNMKTFLNSDRRFFSLFLLKHWYQVKYLFYDFFSYSSSSSCSNLFEFWNDFCWTFSWALCNVARRKESRLRIHWIKIEIFLYFRLLVLLSVRCKFQQTK